MPADDDVVSTTSSRWERASVLAGPVGLVAAFLALGLQCQSNHIAQRANDTAQRALAETQRQTAMAEADFPSLYLDFSEDSAELDESPALPGHTNVRLTFRTVHTRPGETRKVRVELGAGNLVCDARPAPRATFFEGHRVVEEEFPAMGPAKPNAVSVTGIVRDMAFGLVPVLYRITWECGDPPKQGVSVGEYWFVHEGTWPRVYQVTRSRDLEHEPRLSDIVTTTAPAIGANTPFQWYDKVFVSVVTTHLNGSHVVPLGYLEDCGAQPPRDGLVDTGRFPTVLVRPLPGQEHSSEQGIRNGTHVRVHRRVGDWAYVTGAKHTGEDITGWVVARCVKWQDAYAVPPVRMPFEGLTVLRKARWSSLEPVPGSDESQ